MNQTPQPVTSETAALPSIDDLPLPYVELDARGVVTRANRAALAMHPPEQGDLLGQVAFAFLAGGDRVPCQQSFAEAMASRDDVLPAVIRYLYDRSGKFAAYRLHRRVIRDADGNPIGLRVLGVNISEFTEALDEARRRNLWLESVVDSLREAVIVLDATGVITGANPAAEELLGRNRQELIGSLLEERVLLRASDPASARNAGFLDLLVRRHNEPCTLADSCGRQLPVQVSSAPLLDRQTEAVTGVVLMLSTRTAPATGLS